jgi:hypothetical protein
VRTHDTRAALHLTALGEVAYPCAALVVLLTPPPPSTPVPSAAKQRYYRGHTAQVSATALHPSGTLLASAALGADPQIHVWDAHSLHTLACLRGAHAGGIGALAFSTARAVRIEPTSGIGGARLLLLLPRCQCCNGSCVLAEAACWLRLHAG